MLTRRKTHEQEVRRHLNSSEAERRTNKANGDKYSTSLGRLRQSPGSTSPSFTPSYARSAGRCDCHETAPSNGPRTQERDLEFTARRIVCWGNFGNDAIEQVFKSRARGTCGVVLSRRRSHDRIVGDGKRRAGGVKNRVKIIGGGTTQSVREPSTMRKQRLTIAKTCPNSGIRGDKVVNAGV